MQRVRIYVGCLIAGGREVFNATSTPTEATHGKQYAACIGPFITERGAKFAAERGASNPHCRNVADAERLGKRLEMASRYFKAT